jgi:hypothetical protein
MKKAVLIVSTSSDEPTYGPVRELLEARQIPVIVYCTDKVLAGEDKLNIAISQGGTVEMSYNGRSISPDDIGAAWFRKANALVVDSAAGDIARQMHIGNEVRALHDTIWALYPDDMWLNAPEKMRQNNRKLCQLVMAKKLCFAIPATVVGSDWGEIESKLLVDGQKMVVKMVRGEVSKNNVMKLVYTTVLDAAKVEKIRDIATPFPGIYQHYVEKSREWRVTVVGDGIFSAVVDTKASAKDDWRKHQFTDAVRFTHGQLPKDIEEKCLRYLAKAGMKFGAFDFIEEPDGTLVFLECNPNGQYLWLENELGLPISEAIADELVRIAAE